MNQQELLAELKRLGHAVVATTAELEAVLAAEPPPVEPPVEPPPVKPPSGVYNWHYPFPAADKVDPARVRLWRFGEGRPANYELGDILVAVGPDGPITAVENGPPFELLGSIVLVGLDYRPKPNRIGSPFNAANPYRGTNNIIQPIFAANAQSHASWEYEPGQSCRYPFIFWANSVVNFSTNKCHFGDTMRGGIKNAKPMDADKVHHPPCAAVFWNKINIERGPHYADDEYDASGKKLRSNAFHSDGWQQSNNTGVGNTIIWRFANVYINWIMGQVFFCGNQPEKYGFSRLRQKYANVAWEHVKQWDNHPSIPKIGQGIPGTLWNSPRMVMNYEGGFDQNINPVELSDYGKGKYWPVLFEEQCYIKNTANWPITETRRYLNDPGGIMNAGNYGDYRFSDEVKPTQNYPAWAGKIRLLKSTDPLPQVVDPDHCGHQHRITSVAEFMRAIGD